jgi:hypothetical protein
MPVPQYGDYQFDIYFNGLDGQLPKYPVDFASLERKAAAGMPRPMSPVPTPTPASSWTSLLPRNRSAHPKTPAPC